MSSIIPNKEEDDATLELNNIPDWDINKDEQLLVVYTVGRFNPVHTGHMATIKTAIRIAKKYNGVALILLGNGAIGSKSENPLDFNTKKTIIERHIPERYNGFYELREKTRFPVSDIKEFITSKQLTDNRKPYVIHLTAAKAAKQGELPDAQKLGFINVSLSRDGFETSSYAIQPTKTGDEEMSATSIRKFAINQSEDEFIEKYGELYGDMSKTIYETIRSAFQKSEPTPRLSKRKLETTPKSSKRIRTGGTRKRKRKTKKYKNKH
jgi:hypothetical protein